MAQKMIVIDPSKCTACRGCQTACKQWNVLSADLTEGRGTYENPPDLSYNTYTRVLFREVERYGEIKWLFGQNRCMHCLDAGCMKACPVPGAISRTEHGSVVIDQTLCTGCKYCVFGCPFNVPRYDRLNAEGFGTDRAFKCTFCFDRQGMEMEPACTKSCPTGALYFTDKDRLSAIREAAMQRGLKVYDGGSLATHVVFLLEEQAELYGLPAHPAIPVPTFLWRTVMKPIGVVALLAGLVGLLAHYVTVGPRVPDEGNKAGEDFISKGGGGESQ